jgi:hypothetical protein
MDTMVFTMVFYDMVMKTGLPGKIYLVHGCIFFNANLIPPDNR